MGFEDIFENKQRLQGGYRDQRPHEGNRNSHGSHDSHDSHDSHHGHDSQMQFTDILQKIRGNKKLKLLVIVAGIFIITIAIVLIVVFLPLLMKLLNYISQNGIQGLVGEITAFIDKIWKGEAK